MIETIMSRDEWKALLAQLKEPFPESAVMWRAGAVSRDKQRAQALPYAEPRVYEDRLNEVCPDGWSVTFKPWGESRIICELTIHGQTRSSTGEENDGFAPGTSCEAQAFKRACSKFGLGRYLYDLSIPWVDFDAEKKRLLETPRVPQKFLPQAKKETLSKARADAMREELSKLGFDVIDAYALAEKVLERNVADFVDLTEAEATDVWAAAKKEAA